ncbi:DegT/DnrJ/EryC1/StrS family aminotransferase [Geotoga petraea]|jgi:dTDP-4-amino-4,6-dideoxygalactose transaminase|uniref:dTDP-4-amino-4,6-dideoxygalactose transaminase n=1 Tax=Geotoga petraea TaxID=28234 RepID=A0A1G6HXZ5_9BACT|nr:DegT/DnrJ/EryC1/StrS family aminotransferase [Geotoga petraea]MDK2945351.1 perosamine synthetase [Geotoga sp.]SDB99008.1 dTDP-4-amino-4,6-dideoxygalactose transaminase [Geotoga petraea]
MIPLSSPNIGEKEIEYVNNVLKSRHLALGPYLQKFEKTFKIFIDSKYAIAVNSGTSALHLLLRAIGFQRGDELITSSFTFISSANIAVFEGGKPLFIDIDPFDYNIDIKKLDNYIKNKDIQKVKAFVGVDIFGQPIDWDFVEKTLKNTKIKIIEDSCEAIGSEYNGKKIGKYGVGGTFAFYPNKQITTGEGGMIVTDNEEVYELTKSMSNQGRSLNSEWLEHERLGYNYRLDEMSAAMGVAQMERIEWILNERSKKADYYNKLFKENKNIVIPKINYFTTRMSWFVYVLRLDLDWVSKIIKLPQWVKNFDLPNTLKNENVEEWDGILTSIKKILNTLIERLNEKGVQCKNYFSPVHLQPFYKKNWDYSLGDLPVTELISCLTIAIPFYTSINEKDQNTVYKMIVETMGEIENESKK